MLFVNLFLIINIFCRQIDYCLEPGLNPQWQFVLPLTVPRRLPIGFSLSLIVCDVYFETEYNHALFSSLPFGCVGRLCLLDVVIPDMHISLFKLYLLRLRLVVCELVCLFNRSLNHPVFRAEQMTCH
jgi:hypothetical protein